MTQKNPFELRADVLALAKEYMDKQMELNQQYAMAMMEAGVLATEEAQKMFKPYTFEELMAKAQEMYSFVRTKD